MIPSADDGRRTALAQEFTDEMYTAYRHLAKTINYRAKQFLEMVTMHGGVGAAQILLQRGRGTSDGFARLWEAQMLQWSVEASVLKEKYVDLFTDEERETAKQRLEDHGFDVKSVAG
ncbi:hypothetical protein [Amycolatopsis keratiniphila]|uniref:Uncharacterized protein n=1 Tax=Amycolatopsis keratiniphila TaxID=129921 RepID=R4SYG8_9PSEU|nr:hypothetical protein [Amycolatopsis keratiniphila]AGM08379.1 hypothetical protein AORI_5796 [Amycolatopsis keratiniphila]